MTQGYRTVGFGRVGDSRLGYKEIPFCITKNGICEMPRQSVDWSGIDAFVQIYFVRVTMAVRAASCSARFLLVPVP